MLQKKLLMGLSLLGLATAASASGLIPAPVYNPGIYIGIMGGWSHVDEGDGFRDFINEVYAQNIAKPNNVNTFKKDDRGDFGGRVYLGYNFIRYFSIEAGYTFFADNKYHKVGETHTFFDDYQFKVQTYAIDLVAKGILPLDLWSPSMEGWNLFAKLGGAYDHCHWREGVQFTGMNQTEITGSHGSVRPTYAAGIGYDFTPNFGVDLSYTGIWGSDRVHLVDVQNAQHRPLDPAIGTEIQPKPTTHLVAFGMYYKFDM